METIFIVSLGPVVFRPSFLFFFLSPSRHRQRRTVTVFLCPVFPLSPCSFDLLFSFPPRCPWKNRICLPFFSRTPPLHQNNTHLQVPPPPLSLPGKTWESSFYGASENSGLLFVTAFMYYKPLAPSGSGIEYRPFTIYPLFPPPPPFPTMPLSSFSFWSLSLK